ncbi:MAG TPA: UdgX family uracil-DNA binding protein [Opitutaceae bacterium]|nr:UdgX family uracil-DNA binding protein [Opitutaceae bacterium]
MPTNRQRKPGDVRPSGDVASVGPLGAVRRKAFACEACPLYKAATQTVFGEGSADSKIMLIGEQPGDQEDTAGRPFVGPAGKLLDKALERARLPRSSVYLTNTVKHFKYVRDGKRRLHAKPNESEIHACRPWLDTEISLVAPSVVVALGATAAKALAGKDFLVTRERGKVIKGIPGIPHFIATMHPSAILRGPPEDRERGIKILAADLAKARSIGT